MSITDTMNSIGSIFKLHSVPPPVQGGSLLVNSAHSGRDYSMVNIKELNCSFDQLRLLEDFMMDEIAQLSRLGQYGITALEALFPRSFIDPNRAISSLDKAQIRDWTGQYLTYFTPDTYTSLGNGLVPIDAKTVGFRIYDTQSYPTEADIAGRLTFHKIYHAQLQKTLHDIFNRFGGYALLDMHSCHPTGAVNEAGERPRRADIILSDCEGQSCSAEFLEIVRQAYVAPGLTDIAINDPFKGGYITSHYGRGGLGVFGSGQVMSSTSLGHINALQIEVNKRLYWNFDQGREKSDSAAIKEANIAVFRTVDAYMMSLV